MLIILKDQPEADPGSRKVFFGHNLRDTREKNPYSWSRDQIWQIIENRLLGELPDPKYSVLWIEYQGQLSHLVLKMSDQAVQMSTMTTLKQISAANNLSPKSRLQSIDNRVSMNVYESSDPLGSPGNTPVQGNRISSNFSVVNQNGAEERSPGSRFRIIVDKNCAKTIQKNARVSKASDFSSKLRNPIKPTFKASIKHRRASLSIEKSIKIIGNSPNSRADSPMIRITPISVIGSLNNRVKLH